MRGRTNISNNGLAGINGELKLCEIATGNEIKAGDFVELENAFSYERFSPYYTDIKKYNWKDSIYILYIKTVLYFVDISNGFEVLNTNSVPYSDVHYNDVTILDNDMLALIDESTIYVYKVNDDYSLTSLSECSCTKDDSSKRFYSIEAIGNKKFIVISNKYFDLFSYLDDGSCILIKSESNFTGASHEFSDLAKKNIQIVNNREQQYMLLYMYTFNTITMRYYNTLFLIIYDNVSDSVRVVDHKEILKLEDLLPSGSGRDEMNFNIESTMYNNNVFLFSNYYHQLLLYSVSSDKDALILHRTLDKPAISAKARSYRKTIGKINDEFVCTADFNVDNNTLIIMLYKMDTTSYTLIKLDTLDVNLNEIYDATLNESIPSSYYVVSNGVFLAYNNKIYYICNGEPSKALEITFENEELGFNGEITFAKKYANKIHGVAKDGGVSGEKINVYVPKK